MGLRGQTRSGSFRGKVFGIVTADTDGLARRTELHEFPGRDEPYAEDFGKQAKTYTFDAFVTWADRAELVEKCGQPGPGALIHPFWGERTVVCTQCVAREATTHAGLCFLNLTFVEAGKNQFPNATPNTERRVELAGQRARDVVGERFVARFPTGAPQWVTDASGTRVSEISTALERARSLIPASGDLAGFNEVMRAFQDPASLIASPSVLGSTLSSALQKLAGLSTDPLSTLRTLRGFVLDVQATFLQLGATAGTSRELQQQQQDALLRLSSGSAVIEGAVASRNAPLTSYNEASALRETMVAFFDTELDAAGGEDGDDEALLALQDLRIEVLSDLRARGAALATVRTVVLGVTTPAVLLAYQLYEDPDRGDEIAARNRVRHPMFLPAGVTLEVLSA